MEAVAEITADVKKVPELRFPEFEVEWSYQKIDNLVNDKVIDKPLDGNHGNIHPVSSDFVTEGIPFVMANNFKNGIFDLDGAICIKKEQADSLQKGFSYEGDVLLTHKGSVGLTAVVPKLKTEYIMLTPQVTYYRIIDTHKLYNTFLKHTFDSLRFQKRIKVLADGGTRPYIGITLQRQLSIPIPSLPEQKKIASFLSATDNKIQQLSKKKALLEKYKKGVMQQIFSQQIRFKDDNGNDFPEWKEKRLGELVTITSGYSPSSYSLTDEGLYSYIKVDDLNNCSKYQLTGKEYSNQTKGLVKERSIIFPKRGAAILSNKVRINLLPVLMDTNLMAIKGDDKRICTEFLYYKITFEELYKIADTSSIPQINNKHITPYKVNTPCLEDQIKIGDFLSSIDIKINYTSKQLEQAQQFKKGLLQQMFV